jgi:hypothetical protein
MKTLRKYAKIVISINNKDAYSKSIAYNNNLMILKIN